MLRSGLGVNENRGDRLDIKFINSGAKTILMTTELKPAAPPSDIKFPSVGAKSLTSRSKVERAARRPQSMGGARNTSPR
jgi:hypothetical protein